MATHGGPTGHTISYVGACPGTTPCTCRGRIGYGQNALKQIGVTAERLAAGTPCLIADFDGNDVMDLAFVDGNYGSERLAAQVQVLMFDEVGLTATAMLPKRVRSLGLERTKEGRTALIEPGLTAKKYWFVFRDGAFAFEPR